MTTDMTKRLGGMIFLVLLQALVLNHIHILGCATPLLIIMLPLHFSSEQPRWSALLWAFCTGLLADVFSNTPGVAAGAMTFIGFIQPAVLKLFIPHGEDDEFFPRQKDMGWLKYLTYVSIICLSYCTVFFCLEAFSFFNPVLLLSQIGASTLFTIVMVILAERLIS